MLATVTSKDVALDLRGRAGRISRLLLAWKAATRIEPGRASLANALRTTCLEMAAGLLMAGKLAVSLVENARFEAAAQVWRSIVGRTIEAILTCNYPVALSGIDVDTVG